MTSIIDTLTRRNPTLAGPAETAQNLVKNNTHDGGHAKPVETGQFSAADTPPSNLPSRGRLTEYPLGHPALPEAIRQPCPTCKCPTFWRDPYEHWHCANCLDPPTRAMVRERVDLIDVPLGGDPRYPGASNSDGASDALATPAPEIAPAADSAAMDSAAADSAAEKIRWLEKYEPPSPAFPRGRNYHVRVNLTPAEAWIAEHVDDPMSPWAARLLDRLR